jgi:hypothetical protein
VYLREPESYKEVSRVRYVHIKKEGGVLIGLRILASKADEESIEISGHIVGMSMFHSAGKCT